jgi:hypothetical protein
MMIKKIANNVFNLLCTLFLETITLLDSLQAKGFYKSEQHYLKVDYVHQVMKKIHLAINRGTYLVYDYWSEYIRFTDSAAIMKRRVLSILIKSSKS